MDGEIIYLFVYSAGTRFTEEELKGLLKNQEDFSKYEYTKPVPEEIPTFNVPSIFNLKSESLTLRDQQYKFKVQVSIYTLGSFSVRIRCGVSNVDEDLLTLLTFDKEVKEFVGRTAERVRSMVMKNLGKIRQVRLNANVETYRFYYIQSDQQSVMKKYGKLIAGLLVDEKDYGALDDSYVAGVLSKRISYNDTDVFLAGWESSVIIDKSNAYEHELLIAEVANVQLLEMRAYHAETAEKLRQTDFVVDTVNTDLLKRRGGLKKANVILGEFYDDARDTLSRVNDTVVSFGEWYLSKLYSLFESVFKLDDWRGMIENDLQTIEKRRDFLSEIVRWRTEQAMELIVIFLFVLDLILLVLMH
jgi:hypothetical protein